MFKGTKDRGMNTKNERSFQDVVEISGTRACRESAKRTTNARLQSVNKVQTSTM